LAPEPQGNGVAASIAAAKGNGELYVNEKNYSTKAGCDCYLKKWIVPRWGEHTLPSIQASEVEEWLKYLELAHATQQ
jgi:hypothetical protein